MKIKEARRKFIPRPKTSFFHADWREIREDGRESALEIGTVWRAPELFDLPDLTTGRELQSSPFVDEESDSGVNRLAGGGIRGIPTVIYARYARARCVQC